MHVEVRQTKFTTHPQRTITGILAYPPEPGRPLMVFYKGREGQDKAFQTSHVKAVYNHGNVSDLETGTVLGSLYEVITQNSTYEVWPMIPEHCALR